jgi:hypothetical protein
VPVKIANAQGRAVWGVLLASGVVLSLAVFLMGTASLDSRPNPSEKNGVNETSSVQLQMQMRQAERPLSFEPNLGQADRSVKFLSRTREHAMFLKSDGIVLVLSKNRLRRETRNSKPVGAEHDAMKSPASIRDVLPIEESKQANDDSAMNMRVVGANREPATRGLSELPAKSNYYIGRDPRNWRTNVPNYAKVQYENIYPGINLIYYGNQSRLEYDFVVAPGADPAQIHLAFDTYSRGQSKSAHLILEKNGDLAIEVDGQEIRFQKPAVYQSTSQPSVHIPIDGKYVSRGDGQIGFEIGKYDHSKLLVIDPVLQYSTYFGGNQHEQGFGVKLDASGNILMTGATASTNFPLKNAFQTSAGGNLDVFVSKFDPTGTSLVYSTYLAGSGDDLGEGIALDPSGDAYVTGWTSSPNFPTKNALQSALAGAGATNDFLAEFDPNGNLIFSTYFGGTGVDHCYSVQVDSSGIYIAGDTSSTDYPTKNPFQATKLGSQTDAFLTKFTADASSVVYSTYLGGAGADSQAYSVAIDSSQSAYLAGQTSSTSFPIKNAFQSTNPSTQGAEVFVTKFTPDGRSLVYSTYLGGSSFQSAGTIVVDSAGSAYVSGGTSSTDFPLQNPWATKVGGSNNFDGFVTKFAPSGSALIYSTLIGGTSDEFADGLEVDSQGNAHIAGYTMSTDFPTTPDAFQPTSGGSWDGFVVEFNSTGSVLLYSSYLGGSGLDVSDAIGLDSSGNAWVTGTEASTNFPVTSNAFQSSYGGGNDDAYLANVTAAATSALAVTLAGAGSGTVTSSPAGMNCGTICSETFINGTAVTLTATAASGSEFIGWSGACSGTSTCNVTVNSAESLTATFDPPSLPLTVTLAGSGKGTVTSNPSGINCGTTCSASFNTGSQVTLSASPAAGSEFTGWSGACTGMSACTVTMSAAQQAAATFAPTTFTLTANPTSLTVQSGGQAKSTITVALKTAGVGSPVQLSCAVSGATSAPSCGMSPASVTPGPSSVTSALTVTDSAMAALKTPREHPHAGRGTYALFLPIGVFGIMLMGGLGDRRSRIAVGYGLLFLLLAFQFACSNSSKQSATNYTVTITGVSGSVQNTAQVTVTVP